MGTRWVQAKPQKTYEHANETGITCKEKVARHNLFALEQVWDKVPPQSAIKHANSGAEGCRTRITLSNILGQVICSTKDMQSCLVLRHTAT